MPDHDHDDAAMSATATSALAEAAARGDARALEALMDRHLPALRAFVRVRAGHVVRAHESSSDVVQSVCREVLENAERFQHPSEGAFRRWLFRTALRKLSDRRDYHLAEKRDAFRRVPIGDASEDPNSIRESRLVDVYRSIATPSRQLAARDEIERVESALERLSEDEREVIVQAHLMGLSRAEIAESMDRSPGAVRVLLHRALAKLVDMMAGDELAG